MTKQDEQLREALRAIEQREVVSKNEDGSKIHKVTYLTDETVDKLVALFQKGQLQLVSELEGELPDKTPGVPKSTTIGDWSNTTPGICFAQGWNHAVSLMKATVEHKKQELGRGE